jgi:hypothetical protein
MASESTAAIHEVIYDEVPLILNGQFFKILSIEKSNVKGFHKVKIKCANCVSKNL